MTRRERYTRFLQHYAASSPHVTTALHYDSAFQLLVATLLSAQCTDARVNLITPSLFRTYPTAAAMSQATEEEIYAFIRSVSYPNAKARHLLQMSQALVERFAGEVPDDDEALESLAGVGRKTANVVRAVYFHAPCMPVDTHVFRVAHRLSLVSEAANTPLKVEQEMYKYIPGPQMIDAHHWLILHGREICLSRRPRCTICPFVAWCPTAVKTHK